MFKQKMYEVVANTGVAVLSKIFPEQFACDGVKPSDRYIEYNFTLKNLPKPPVNILDVGCVSSFFPLILAGFGYQVTGLDMRKYQITEALAFPNFKFIQHNIVEKLLPKVFDCVTAISTIEHIGIHGRYGAKKDDFADFNAIRNIRECLKDNGTLILTIPVGKYKVVAPYQRIYGWQRINKMTFGFKLEEERYYIEKHYWRECDRIEAFSVESSKTKYALGLYKFTKI